MTAGWLFQYQAKTEAPEAFESAVPRFESAWHEPWSEPVRQKIAPALAVALMASGLFAPVSFHTIQPGPTYESQHHQPWSEPVRIKPHFLVGTEQYQAWDPRLPVQPFSLLEGWYNWLSEPVRLKPGLPPQLQQFLAYHPRILPNPSVTMVMRVTEINTDVAEFSLSVYNPALTARVSIVEIPAIRGGNVSVEG